MTMTVLLTTIIAGLFGYLLVKYLYWYFTKARRIIRMTAHLKSPGRHILWGSLHLHPGVRMEALDWVRDLSDKCGGIYKMWLGPMIPQVFVCHPDYAKKILLATESKPMSVRNYGTLSTWIGNGLLVSDGQVWKRNRRLLTPTFHFEMLKTYIDVMNRTTSELIATFDIHARTRNSFEVCQPAGLFALDAILKCVFSFEEQIQGSTMAHPVVRLVHEGMDIIFERVLAPYLWPQCLFNLSPSGRRFKKVCKEYHKITRSVIQSRKLNIKQPLENTAKHCHDFLDIMLLARDENGDGMTDAEIEAEVKTFLFAGHDTTSSALSWTLYALATHPDYQNRCLEEIRGILNGRQSDDITCDDLTQLKYLSMVIKETMRHHTTVPMIARQLNEDTEVNGHLLPKGLEITIMLHTVHHNPDVWPDPDTFNPERFQPENVNKNTTFNFVPFSAGPRNCIGQKFALNMLKVALARIVNRYEISYDTTHPIIPRPEATLKAEKGIWLNLKQRPVLDHEPAVKVRQSENPEPLRSAMLDC